MSDGAGPARAPEVRDALARFWRRVVIVLVIQTVAIVALVKLLPGASS